MMYNDRNDNMILQGQYYIGDNCTNNVAEYFGLIKGLKALRASNHHVGRLVIEGDSQLVINKLKGKYNVHSSRLRPLYQQAMELMRKYQGREFDVCNFAHIDREYNGKADQLANDAIQEQQDWLSDYY